jgi:hypothetical protein
MDWLENIRSSPSKPSPAVLSDYVCERYSLSTFFENTPPHGSSKNTLDSTVYSASRLVAVNIEEEESEVSEMRNDH